jgi:hypothetical protein
MAVIRFVVLRRSTLLDAEGLDVDQVDRRQRPNGYRLIAEFSGGVPVATAGFRIVENLAMGRHLYVDDLITHRGSRGRGHGCRLISWLTDLRGERGSHPNPSRLRRSVP